MTPTDQNSFVGEPPLLLDFAIDEIRISVSFSYDISYSEILAKQWERIAPVKLGGPAFNIPSGDFIPGLYLKPGNVITSRGCPNKCWFCKVWRREGTIRELPIMDGWIVHDDNLLASSKEHIIGVFKMLMRQKNKPISFAGGLDASLLKDWHIEWLLKIKPTQMFFAYDTPDDMEPLRAASKKLQDAKFTLRQCRCYCLMGYKGDTFDKARERIREICNLGFLPMAMVYQDENGLYHKEWRRFARTWARPCAMLMAMKGGKKYNEDFFD